MRQEKETIVFQIIGYTIISVISVGCLLPFVLLISASFTEEQSIYRYGYRIIPKVFSTEAYSIIFKAPQEIIRAYGVSTFITIVGTVVGLFVSAMTAYVLLRKDFKYRNNFAFFFYFTSLFHGGLIPTYILIVRYLNLKDSYLALILPPLLGSWNILLMRNFMRSVPETLAESAKIDGANDFYIFWKIYMPLSIPGLATVGLFIALMYWNDWYNAMLYIDSFKKYPLQYFLYNMLNSIRFAEIATSQSGIPFPDLPGESLKMAMAVVATGPIVFLYPYLQKYFIKGLTIGAVKG